MREEIDELLDAMSEAQLVVVYRVAVAVSTPLSMSVNPASDFASEQFAEALGLKLIMHHAASSESFTKDKFEHAMVLTLTEMDREASLAPRGNRGHDIAVGEERWSLKTQADAAIRPDVVHISKFMELGKGPWDSETDLLGLRDQMLKHMAGYDRIFTLRCLSAAKSNTDTHRHHYELLEIPKRVLALPGRVEMVHASSQNPKPGHYWITNADDALLLDLYFDGGTERKLQIQRLRTNLCVTHANWSFRVDE